MLTHTHTHFPIVLPLRYRITSNRISNSLPFRINLTFEDSHGHGRTDIIIRLDCDIPNKSYGSNITVRIPLSKTVTSCAYELGAPAQTVAYSKDEKVLFGVWCGGALLWLGSFGCVARWCNKGQPSHATSLSPSLMCLGPRRRWRHGSCQRQMAGCRTTAD